MKFERSNQREHCSLVTFSFKEKLDSSLVFTPVLPILSCLLILFHHIEKSEYQKVENLCCFSDFVKV